jgi:gliding motility-associated-like protein
MKIKTLLIIVFLSMFCCNANAQLKYCGKEFFISLGGSTGDTIITPIDSYFNSYNHCFVQIASVHNATVKFYYKSIGLTKVFHITPNAPMIDTLSIAEIDAIVDHADEIVRNQTLEITADSNITVNFLGGDGGKADDAMCILPCDGQRRADTYMLLGMHSTEVFFTQPFTYSIVAATDNVVLEITPAANTNYHPAGVPYTITMNRGQEYRIGTPSHLGTMPLTNDDITGTLIKVVSAPTCFPIEVFMTYDAIYINWPTTALGACCADVLLEQIMPMNLWDTLYPVAPFMYDSLTIVRVLSSTNGNTIYYDHTPVRVLNSGQFFDTLVIQDKPAVISSSYPIGVAQFMISGVRDSGQNDGDPSMLWNFPIKHGVKNAVFKPYQRFQNMFNPVFEWLAIISETSNTASVKLNGNNISGQFRTFPHDAAWQYAIIRLNMDSTYSLTSSRPVVAYHYEEESWGAYTFPLSDLTFTYGDTGLTFKSDTVYKCIGGTATLTGDYAATYLWSTGETSQSIRVTTTGLFTVFESTNDGCINSEKKHDFFVIQNDTLKITDTLGKCKGAALTLHSDAAQTYNWNTGESTQAITVTEPGRYSVTAITIDSCTHISVHTFEIEDKIFPPINLGRDTMLCSGDELVLKTAYASASWSSGVTGDRIKISAEGIYYATATDSCEVMHTDTIIIKTDICLDRYCDILFPNAFTPNGDGKNELFRPIKYGLFNQYTLRIFNRWGELVFESNDIDAGWDGVYKSVKAEAGVYFYYCTAFCPAKGSLIMKGDVTLIR